jgi:beta-phosphoglucomutase
MTDQEEMLVLVSTIPAAAIFDMDGVLVDSNPFHLRKWIDLLDECNISYSPEDLPQQIFGIRNDDAFRHFFGPQLTQEEIRKYSERLEERFRAAFRPHARPLPGLEPLIRRLDAAGVPMAVASSAIRSNIEFVVDALGFRRFFKALVSGDDVRFPKPHPEIYLKTANELGVNPADCVGFEDSFPGVGAVKAAGMKCVAIASTFPIEGLRPCADLAVASFNELSIETLQQLFTSGAVTDPK